MSKSNLIAEKLASDWRGRVNGGWLSGDLAPASIDEAYDASARFARILEPERGKVAGRKIALSSKPMQELCGIDHPLAGRVFANEIFTSPATIELSSYIHMGLEFELAMEIAKDLPPGSNPTRDNIQSLVSMVRPAFEMIEDRGADYSEIEVGTITADNAWGGGIVIGEPIPDWRELDFDNMKSVCSQPGTADVSGNTGAADPWGSLVWVINHFNSRGETIKAGEQIITGSVIHTRFPAPGDKVTYTVGNIASVEAHFN